MIARRETSDILCGNISKTPGNRADTRCHCEPDALGAVALRIDIYAGHQRADFSLGLGGLQFQPGSALLDCSRPIFRTSYSAGFLLSMRALRSGNSLVSAS
jgi:hypothetical protein